MASEDFEEDEPVEEIMAIFDAGDKQLTAAPELSEGSWRQWAIAQALMDGVQEQLAKERELSRMYASQLGQIRALLNTVSTYEGIVDASSTVLMIADLVRDHEELETRIEAVLSMLPHLPDHAIDDITSGDIVRILRGGSIFPDTPEQLEG